MGKSSIETAQATAKSKFLKIDFLGSKNNVATLFEVAAKAFLEDQHVIGDFVAQDFNHKSFVPLVFCESYERLRNDGVNFPREFVIEQSDFFYREVDGKGVSGFSVLKNRLSFLRDSFNDVP